MFASIAGSRISEIGTTRWVDDACARNSSSGRRSPRHPRRIHSEIEASDGESSASHGWVRKTTREAGVRDEPGGEGQRMGLVNVEAIPFAALPEQGARGVQGDPGVRERRLSRQTPEGWALGMARRPRGHNDGSMTALRIGGRDP